MKVTHLVSSGSSGIYLMFIYVIYLGFFGVSIFCIILLIRLALRGIKALDIYIAKNRNL